MLGKSEGSRTVVFDHMRSYDLGAEGDEPGPD